MPAGAAAVFVPLVCPAKAAVPPSQSASATWRDLRIAPARGNSKSRCPRWFVMAGNIYGPDSFKRIGRRWRRFTADSPDLLDFHCRAGVAPTVEDVRQHISHLVVRQIIQWHHDGVVLFPIHHH